MPNNNKKIFIITFLIAGLVILGVYFLTRKTTTDSNGNKVSFYQKFNPFKSDKNNPQTEGENPGETTTEGTQSESSTKFAQITDFAVSGATYLDDSRLIDVTNTDIEEEQPKEIKTIIDSQTKEGRKEIQKILNETLKLKQPLVIDGNFGAKAVAAIKEFQKINNLPITGKIDADTAPYFTKITKTTVEEKSPYEKAASIRFVERKNGHVYKMFLDTKVKEKISNITLASIYESFFSKSATNVIYRYLSQGDEITTLLMNSESKDKEFLPENITDMTTSLDQTKMFYLVKNSNGSTGVIRNFDDKKESVVFNSPFTEWLPQWTNNQNIFLTTKPYFGTNGSIFLLNTRNKTISKLFGGVPGLTTLVNANSSNILYSASTSIGPRLNVFNISKHESLDLKTAGLPEKCVWANDDLSVYCAIPNVIIGNQYPNSWYQGLVSFDDYFVKINTQTGESTTLANSRDGTPVDAINLFVSREEDKLFFINKKDYTLWSLDL